MPRNSDRAVDVRWFLRNGELQGAWISCPIFVSTDFNLPKPLSFGTDPILVLALQSSSTSVKPEEVQASLTQNDLIREASQAEVFCIKQGEFQSFSPLLKRDGYPSLPIEGAALTLIIQRKTESLRRINEEHYCEIIKLSTGRRELIG
jgi:hypothetical protein